jgi:hypothetical protein
LAKCWQESIAGVAIVLTGALLDDLIDGVTKTPRRGSRHPVSPADARA